MSDFQKKKIKFIINPISGTRKKELLETDINKYINHDKFDLDIVYTAYAQHAIELAKEAVEKSYDAVIAIGGDGSVNEVSKALVDSKTALGIVPNGSGNGLAHYLKISINVKKAIEIINEFKVIPIDTVSVNAHLFVSIAGIGFDALVADDFSHVKRRGFFSYLKIIIKNYILYYRKKYIIYIGDKKIKRKAMMITLANSNQFGYNTVIAPDAIINDGLIDVCIIKKIPIYEAGVLSLLLLLKQINMSNRIEIIKANKLSIIQSKNRPIHVDGDPKYIGKKLDIQINPLSLNVIVPQKTYNYLTTTVTV